MPEQLRCCLCARPARELHHLTQRDLDPETVLPLCHDHHQMMDDDWNTAGIRANLQPATCLHAWQLRLQRMAMFFQRLAAGSENPLAATICITVGRWLAKGALELKLIIEVFDQRFPGWQEALREALPNLQPTQPPTKAR